MGSKHLAVVAVLAGLLSPAAQAVTAYVGGGAGFGEVQDFCTAENRMFCEEEGGVLRGFAGFRFSEYFALEASFDALVGLQAPGARARGLDGDTDMLTLSFNALTFIPLAERVWIYGGGSVGASVVSTDISAADSDDSRRKDWDDDWDDDDWDSDAEGDSEYESDVGVALGGMLGVEVKFSEDIRGRVQWQHWNQVDGERAFYGKRDVDLYSANFVWMF
jgi:hypothetical protein